MKWRYLIVIVASLLVLFGCAPQEVKPPQDCIYEAWQGQVGHCHGHIWWAASK